MIKEKNMREPSRRDFMKSAAAGLAGLSLTAGKVRSAMSTDRLPDFIIIFVDDMGYGDWNRAGHPTIRTPNLNRMADEGVVMTQFYSAAAVCSPSRASLLTGRYPVRNGVIRVLNPMDALGLPDSELTLAQPLKKKGYATAAIGKWHLGHLPQYLPTHRGFDSYFGVPYSNDMDKKERGHPPIPLMRGEKIIEQPCDQDTLTKRYTEEAVRLINEYKDRPFFIYLAHSMPHVPLHASEAFRGKSKRGLYGDVIEEIDWSVGQVLDALQQAGIDHHTFVAFTSDNGPWAIQKQAGGSAGLLRGSKASTWEGGVREPFIARFPEQLPKGVVNSEVGSTMDLFTTCLSLAGVDVPNDRPIDGKNLLPVLKGEGKSPHEVLYYFWSNRLTAIRVGRHKLHFRVVNADNKWQDCAAPELYDLEADPSERFDLAADLPETVAKLAAEAERIKAEIAERGENKELIEQLLPRKQN